MRVHVELSHDLHPDEWRRRHDRGEVPDRLPYGLDYLADNGIDATFRTPLRGRAKERLARAARAKGAGYEWLGALAGLPAAGRRSSDAIFCWHEHTAVPVILRERSVLRGKPVVTGLIWLTDGDDVSPGAAKLARHALPHAAAIWVLSRRQLDPLMRDWGVAASRLHYVEQGIDTDFFTAAPSGQAEPGLVVSAGNDRHRDHPMLVEAVRRARLRLGSARLELASRLPVPIEPELGLRHTGLTERDVAGLYARASVVAVATGPNLHASGLTVALEAMASARPLVVPDDSGIAEYVVPGETALVYRTGDVDSLAAALEQLLAEPDAAAAMGVAGRRRVEENYTTRAQAARLASVLRTI